MFRQFKFEESLYPKLERLPISTRFKLEILGLQVPLSVWGQLALEERWVLCHMPIRSRSERECYYGYTAFLFRRHGVSSSSPSSGTGVPERKPWEELSRVPFEVVEKMSELNLPLFWPEWIKLDDMERYTLFKVCQEKLDKVQIQQVVQELLRLPAFSSIS